MKILYVIFSYYPSGSAEANILYKLNNEMKKEIDCEISVLTTKKFYDEKSIDEINNIKIYKTDFETNYKISKIKFKVLVVKCMDYLIRKVYKKNFYNRYLIKKIYKGLKKFKLYDFDVIVPVGGFYETFLASKKFIQNFKLRSKLVFYQLDPIANNSTFSKKTYKKRFKYEENMSTSCDLILTTPELILQKKSLGIDISNCKSFEFPLISNLTNLSAKNIDDKKMYTAFFVGTLNENLRNPIYALEVMSRLNNIKFLIAGTGCDDIIKKYANDFSEKIIYLGKVSLNDSLNYQQKSDFLVNIGNSDYSFLPSKMFDYISTGKPIINFCKSEACPTLKYLNKYKNQFSILEDYNLFDEQLLFLDKFIQKNHNLNVDYEEIRKNFSDFTVDFVSLGVYKLYSEIIKK